MHAALLALDTWQAHHQVAAVLEKVEVAPALLFSVVGLAPALAADGAGKLAASLEIN
jgi:hypothetical protein